MVCSIRARSASIYRLDEGMRRQGLGHRRRAATARKKHGRASEVTPGVMAIVTSSSVQCSVVKSSGEGAVARGTVAARRW